MESHAKEGAAEQREDPRQRKSRHNLSNTIVLMATVSFVALVLRWPGLDFISNDAKSFLLPWYDKISELELAALGQQVGNYGIPYQFLILVGTYTPLPALALYKSISIAFDYLLAWQVFLLVQQISRSETKAAIAYGVILILPPVVANSAVWGQCDAIYSCFAVAAIRALFRNKPPLAFFLLGVALSFKLQACFIVPFFAYCLLFRRIRIIPAALWAVLGFYLLSIPGIIAGRSLFAPLEIYFGQAATYAAMYLNYPSFWVMISNNFEFFKLLAIGLTVFVLLAGFCIDYRMRRSAAFRPSHHRAILLATWSAWTCVEFLPAMHERYGYLIAVLLIVCLFCMRNWKLPLLCCLIVIACDCVTYSNYLFNAQINLLPCSIALFIAWAIFGIQVFLPSPLNASSTGTRNQSEGLCR